mmetsp:Transcript_11061/g.36315  ORF Transcript_11061/g.36315 Transcript_11061/m.36315 type:complete len:208 (+) Transcript_11061:340-963(+)
MDGQNADTSSVPTAPAKRYHASPLFCIESSRRITFLGGASLPPLPLRRCLPPSALPPVQPLPAPVASAVTELRVTSAREARSMPEPTEGSRPSSVFSCACASLKNAPPSPRSRSSWYVPSSTTAPFCSTAILSAFLIVERRCAMVTVVRLCCDTMLSSAACTTRSPAVSSADVASSSSSTAGLRTMARAIATRCFWPPESMPPPCPT